VPRADQLRDVLPIKVPLEKVEEALKRAERLASLLLGRPILPLEGHIQFLSNGDRVLLEHWPIISTRPVVDMDRRLGILFTTNSKTNDTIFYRVGFIEGDIPALFTALIEAIATWLLTEEPGVKELVADYVRVGRHQRATEEAERNGQTS